MEELKFIRPKYTRIARTMSEINEEMDEIEKNCEGSLEGFLLFSTLMLFSDWLCGVTNLKVSGATALSKFVADSIGKGVPIEDVESFALKKMNELMAKELERKLDSVLGGNDFEKIKDEEKN